MEQPEEDISNFSELDIDIKIRLLEYYLDDINKNNENIKKQKNHIIIQDIIKSIKRNKFKEDSIVIKNNRISSITGVILDNGLLLIDDKDLYNCKKQKTRKKLKDKLKIFI